MEYLGNVAKKYEANKVILGLLKKKLHAHENEAKKTNAQIVQIQNELDKEIYPWMDM